MSLSMTVHVPCPCLSGLVGVWGKGSEDLEQHQHTCLGSKGESLLTDNATYLIRREISFLPGGMNG